MKKPRKLIQTIHALSLGALLLATTLPAAANAQSDASLTMSAMPLASVVIASGTGLSVAGAASTAAVALPAALSVVGSKLVIISVEVLASGTVYVVERVSDAARATIKIATKTARASAMAVGTAVVVSASLAGVLLYAGSEVLAFIPNELGRSLFYNERLTNERLSYERHQ
jgi:hypothetical protein